MGRKTITILLCALTLGATEARTSISVIAGGLLRVGFPQKIKVHGKVPSGNNKLKDTALKDFLQNAKAPNDPQKEELAKREQEYKDAVKAASEVGASPDSLYKFMQSARVDDTQVNTIFNFDADGNATGFQADQPATYVTLARERLNVILSTSGPALTSEQRQARQAKGRVIQSGFDDIRNGHNLSFNTTDGTLTEPVVRGVPASDSEEILNKDAAVLIGLNKALEDLRYFLSIFTGGNGTGDPGDNAYIQADKLRGLSAKDLLSENLSGDYDVETADPFKSLDLSAFIICLYEINDMFKVGVAANIGYSFRELNIKNTPIKMNESLTGKLGLAIGITDFFQIHVGLGFTRREISFKVDSDYDESYNLVNTKLRNTHVQRQLGFDSNALPNKDDTAGHNALFAYGDLVVTIPFGENFVGLISAGYQSDLNKCEADVGGCGNTRDDTLKMEGYSQFNIGVGVGYKII